MSRDEFLKKWRVQCDEWYRIALELQDEAEPLGDAVTAYQVSLEQRKRALAEGRRLVTYADLENATP